MCASFLIPHECICMYQFWPGLGASETVYAWAITAFGIGELAPTPLIGYLVDKLPYTSFLLIANVFNITGGVLYALAEEGWMVILARLLFGMSASFKVVMLAYIGEMGARIDKLQENEGKKPVKYIFYIILSFVLNGTYVVAFGRCPLKT